MNFTKNNSSIKLTNTLLFNQNKLITVILGTILILAISLLLAYLRSFFPFETSTNTKGINERIDANILRILSPLLLSPIIEEFIFRKWIPNAFQEVLGRKKTIVLSNMIFAIFHLDLYFLPYLANGLIYALYYEKTNDLKVPIIMHVLYNVTVFLATFY
ncbi:CPBP family intramembrane glutamic endopeptidase [Peribacillus sp. R9-11]|uniref:CPBP family intramembrane glutamic endopeptidase n=1 Tax=Peribacillus sp. R9-11 TaxID=3073271 RepID=UPI002868BF6C|nr:CPBP family intramembrane glutamic endopeptidase [Peribacillus sp. R9-11]WMX58508.1 CPBP family intramembrane glutamic endopeptidase [Peribacillus sp. R9-11]